MKKTNIQKAIFKTLARKRALSLDNLKKEVENTIKSSYTSKNRPEYAISRSIKNLAGEGLVECFKTNCQSYFRLTEEGRKRINNNAIDNDTAIVSNSWDGFWRIIILDLPEERKSEREALRYLLKKAGFVCLKNSVWISMFPYEHLFTNIKNDLNLSSEMMIIVTSKIDEATEKEFLNSIKKQ